MPDHTPARLLETQLDQATGSVLLRFSQPVTVTDPEAFTYRYDSLSYSDGGTVLHLGLSRRPVVATYDFRLASRFILNGKGNPLDGDADGVPGGDYQTTLEIRQIAGEGFDLPQELQPGSPSCVTLADISGDGHNDILMLSGLKVVYLTNQGTGRFLLRRKYPWRQGGILRYSLADLDGDGDLDLLPNGTSPAGVLWYENSAGGESWIERYIPNSHGFYSYAADLTATETRTFSTVHSGTTTWAATVGAR